MHDNHERLNPQPDIRITSYKEGYFQPNGSFSSDRMLSDKAITEWERQNTEISGGKAWGKGQGLFFNTKRPLIFGRHPKMVDVVIDGDPDEDGFSMPEGGVSRRHFGLEVQDNTTILITDLNSKNGVEIYKGEGTLKAKLKGENKNAQLEIGDFALFGGGNQEDWGRLIGFRVCQNTNGQVFLVKFNVGDMKDLMALVPIGRQLQIEQSVNQNEKLNTDPRFEEAYQKILSQFEALHSEHEKDKYGAGYFRQSRKLYTEIFDVVEQLGQEANGDDFSLTAARIGRIAMEKAEALKNEAKIKEAARSLELSLLLMKIAQGEVIQKVDDQDISST